MVNVCDDGYISDLHNVISLTDRGLAAGYFFRLIVEFEM